MAKTITCFKPKDVFRCPDCGENRIEEIMTDVVVASQVVEMYDGDDLEYGSQTNDGGTIDRYQCMNCGWTIPCGDSQQDLFDYFNRKKSKDTVGSIT